ncbi:T9SS type A sorting domain-containing protein [candidate division WOR-3 bacterium]|nr:T9SS type A sorting domain-containing protein [candidate division WOR-3 bacterium]
MKYLLQVLLMIIITTSTVNSQAISQTNRRDIMRLDISRSDITGLDMNFVLGFFEIADFEADGIIYQEVSASGIVLPGEPGKPGFPAFSKVIAVPKGAEVMLNVSSAETEIYEGVLPVPAFEIPSDNDDSPLRYIPDSEIYLGNKTYPSQNVFISEKWSLRGVDLVTITVMPFSWNSESEILTVYNKIDFSVSFSGGQGKIGEDRLRTQNWDRVLRSLIINYSDLPKIDYAARTALVSSDSKNNAEFIILVPDDSIFIVWAESIRDFRIEEGIITQVFTLTDIGGSTSTIIDNFISDAYYNWTIPPEAVLILSDYPASGKDYGITSPMYNSYCVSDNIYADVDGDNLPDMAIGRICAQNEDQLREMITKDFELERNPTTEALFYDNPISACGWQYERWFQLCAEVIWGFWDKSLSKDPVRVYAIYQAPNPAPGMAWSSAAYTSTVVNYFNALGYIEMTVPNGINWYGTAADIVNSVNSGAFMLQHRDHGSVDGWGEPGFNISNINQLQNLPNKYPFVMSTNCLTGKYNNSSEVFAERFHRITEKGAVGVNAASEVSYSFVNDVYAWGLYDYLWPWFDPNQGSGSEADVRPGWAMMYAKYYLSYSSWCGSTSKPVTYHLMHHFGDPYMRMCSEVPQHLTVTHPDAVLAGVDSFAVEAPAGSIVAFSRGANVIGRGEGTGSLEFYSIEPQNAGDTIKLAVISQNFYRYTRKLMVVPASLPFVVFSHISDTTGGNSNGQFNPGQTYSLTLQVSNWGGVTAQNVLGYLTSSDPNVTILNDTVNYGSINSMDTTQTTQTLGILLSNSIPDSTSVLFEIRCFDSNDSEWTSQVIVMSNSPDLSVSSLGGPETIEPGNDFRISAGLKNSGSGTAYEIEFSCEINDSYFSVPDSHALIDSLLSQEEVILDSAFRIIVAPSCPQGRFAEMILTARSQGGMVFSDTFTIGAGVAFAEDFETGGPTWSHSGPSSWHVTEHASHSPVKSMYCGNENSWQYSNSVANSRVISPDLHYVSNSVLSFWHRYEMANNYDKVQLQYSTDGGTIWTLINPEEGYTGAWAYAPYDSIYTGSQTAWQEQNIRLYGEGTMKLSWLFFSNPTISAEGYYFDDVTLSLGSGFVGAEEEETPVERAYVFAINRIYPNPMRNRAVIAYSIGEESMVSVSVYDVSGRIVRTLVDAVLKPGTYRSEWDGRDEFGQFVGSGTYFYRMTAGSFSAGEKLILIR